jgi:hypothetical protein
VAPPTTTEQRLIVALFAGTITVRAANKPTLGKP